MPRNSDFPDYKGIRVEHVNDWDALQYHAPSGASSAAPKSAEPKEDKGPGGFQPVKGMVSPRKRRVHNQPDGLSPDHHEETAKAAAKEWRERGYSNNEIIDF